MTIPRVQEIGGGDQFLLTADTVEDGIVSNLIEIGTLDFNTDTVQGFAESILRGGVDHLSLDLGTIGRPNLIRDEKKSQEAAQYQ